jgi:hypothetical protein
MLVAPDHPDSRRETTVIGANSAAMDRETAWTAL